MKRLKKGKVGIGFSPISPILSVCPAVFAILIFVVFPSVLNIVISFTDYTGNLNVSFKFVGFDNYKALFTTKMPDIWGALKITLIFTVSIVIIQQAFSIFIALLVNMRLRLASFYRAVYFMPSILGVVVVGLVWTLMFDPYSSMFAYILELFGKSSAFLGDMNLALPLVIFVTIWANFGYAMTIYLAGIQNIPIELYEAGYIDGTNKWSSFRYITFPLLRPAITVNFWISISGCLGMYDLTLILTNGGPANSTRTFALYFFQQVTQVATNQGQVAALSLFWFVIISTIMLTFNYFMKRKEVEI